MRKTKIIATLGPATNDYNVLKELSKQMDVGRFNFSHGTYESHSAMLALLRKASKEVNRPIAALLDTKGPEIRTGLNQDGKKIKLVPNTNITITTKNCICNENTLSVSYKGFINDVKIGDTILIDDGQMELKIIEKRDDNILCKIITGGELGERKGINLPGVKVNLPDLTEQDIKDIEFGITAGFDIIAASFVRSAKCINQIKDILKKHNSKILVIAKIESQEAIENIDEIIDVVDGIMVARGDLGVELKQQKVPYLQKLIIDKCNKKGKLVITATQMLNSMIDNPRPTRAEVTDVANAIYDGTDVIMLSGETANGKYPIESINMMNDIAIEIESHINNSEKLLYKYQTDLTKTITNSICKSIALTSNELNASAIIAPSISGHTAQVISKFKPSVPILALSKNEQVVRQLMLYYDVIPFLSDRATDSDTIVENAITKLKENNYLKKDDIVIVAFGRSITKGSTSIKPHTNIMRIETIE